MVSEIHSFRVLSIQGVGPPGLRPGVADEKWTVDKIEHFSGKRVDTCCWDIVDYNL